MKHSIMSWSMLSASLFCFNGLSYFMPHNFFTEAQVFFFMAGIILLTLKFLLLDILIEKFPSSMILKLLYKIFSYINVFLMNFSAFLFIMFFVMGYGMFHQIPLMLITGIFALVSLILSYLGIRQMSKIAIKYHTFKNSPYKNDLKIALVADNHFGHTHGFREATLLLEVLTKENPDLVFFAGDMFDGSSLDWEHIKKPLMEIGKKWKVYYTPGNHEEYGDYKKFINHAKECNFYIVQNECVYQKDVPILGYVYQAIEHKELFEKLIISHDNEIQNSIIMLHKPDEACIKLLSKFNPYLILCGHSHNGQFWPLTYLSPLIYGKWCKGVHRLHDTNIVTSVGMGTTHITSRLFNTPEIYMLTLKK